MAPILCVVGARPNFMKIGPLMRAFREHTPPLPAVLLHTGQHYDYRMSEQLFADLGIPAPEVNLEVGSGSHAEQTAEIMKRIEPAIDRIQPSCILVVGDVNSTIAAALVASKKGVPVVHVEAGLRSLDRSMPEEINRVLTDAISDLLFTTEASAEPNLLREGIAAARIRFAGNVMIDSVLSHVARAVPVGQTLERAGAADAARFVPGSYGLVTLHRPSNVDEPAALAEVADILLEAARDLPLVFPAHPRTRARLESAGFLASFSERGIAVIPPVGYLEMLGLMRDAQAVLTDSGGVQEETTALGVPCLTMRENTERPITIAEGTNTLVGRDKARILACLREIREGGGKKGRMPALWDGHAAERIAAALAQWLAERAA
jgi:UDP-N-acetylglucosamine 2-epimerase (non-hydrolysing)